MKKELITSKQLEDLKITRALKEFEAMTKDTKPLKRKPKKRIQKVNKRINHQND